MQINRRFPQCFFPASVVESAIDRLRQLSGKTELRVGNCSLDFERDSRTYPELADWLTAYRRPNRGGFLVLYADNGYDLSFRAGDGRRTAFFDLEGTSVGASSPTEAEAEQLLEVFEAAREKAFIPTPELPPSEPEPVRIFIGHGRSQAYRDLRDHLADLHGYEVEVFESGSRAGHTVRDILDSALRRSTIAFLVLTGDDEQADGDLRARQNVVHEVGLFQGRLGWHRGIIVVEEDIELFSNIDGVQQIRFSNGRIREAFGDVLAVLRREFEDR